MSLIHEALEKTGQDKEKKPAKKSVAAQFATDFMVHGGLGEPAPDPEKTEVAVVTIAELKKKPILSARELVVIGLICGVALVLLFFLIQFSGKSSVERPTESMKVFESAPEPKVGVGLLRKFLPGKKKAEENFVLSGISLAGNERYAVINDQLFAVGEYLNNETMVTDIRDKKVLLESRGESILLSL